MTLRRHNSGQLGFNVHNEGMVVDVEPNGQAQVAGLRQSSRLVEVCTVHALLKNKSYCHRSMISAVIRLTYYFPEESP